MDIISIEPQQELKQVVKKFWFANFKNVNGYEKSKMYSIISDGAPGIIFQHSNNHSAVFDKNGSPLPISFVYGQSTNPCKNYIIGSPFIFGVNFQATALRTLFAVNAPELTNSIFDINNFFPQKFIDLLLDTSNPQNIARLFSIKIAQQLQKQKQDSLIDQSILLIMKDTTKVNSMILSSFFNISRRQFQRRFKEYVGLSPEMYIRIIKFQKSIHFLINRKYNKLSDIAYQLNFTDQSYFNKEFRLFSGYTPNEFLKTSTSQYFSLQNKKYPLEPLRIVKY